MAKMMTQKAAPGLGIDADLARKLLRDMVLIRRFEEKAAEAYALGKIGGFLHLSIGEEAVAAGATSVLRRDDYAISTYREHGHCLIKGSDPRRVMAELFGRVDGLSKGKGGSLHLFDKEHNFLGGHAIVGAHLPLAAGVGFAIKYRGGDQVIVCYFGDGAVPEGEFHEALNLAALWKLPVIFLCENNRYAMGTSLERARRDKTPALLEVRTYRFRGHSMRDPAGAVYRTKEEVEREKLRDPIVLFHDRALKAGVLSDDDVKAVEKDVNDRIDDAVAFADASPEPPVE